MEGIHVPEELITANNGEQIKSRFGPIGQLSHWSDTKSIYKISLGLCEGRGVWYLRLSVCACVLGEGRTGLK